MIYFRYKTYPSIPNPRRKAKSQQKVTLEIPVLRTAVADADNILISSGVYSESFSKKFGVEVPIQSERGYHLELFETNIRIKYPIQE